LALRLAADRLDAFPDGVWLVELASLTDSALVPRAIASALGIREPGAHELLDAVAESLHDGRVLLLLDNCEHLVSAVAQVGRHLLRACPTVRVLATSREALGVEGETAFAVPSLSLPAAPQLESAEALLQAESARLFVERARAARPGLVLSKKDIAIVADICVRLDGIPLALELAAARARVLGLEQLAARLDNRFRLLVGGYRTSAPRHQTLRAALDWSHDLLTEQERVLLRRIAVFACGFSLEAAEAVCGAGLDDVVSLLGALIDKSLLLVDGGSASRFRMLETVRE
jgi:predicted ATPase